MPISVLKNAILESPLESISYISLGIRELLTP
jgi:hypothetical protein